jgi:hypothetical protein
LLRGPVAKIAARRIGIARDRDADPRDFAQLLGFPGVIARGVFPQRSGTLSGEMVESTLHWDRLVRFLRSAVTSFPGMCAIARQTMKRVVVCLATAPGVASSLDFLSTHNLVVASRAESAHARVPRVSLPGAPGAVDARSRNAMAQ